MSELNLQHSAEVSYSISSTSSSKRPSKILQKALTRDVCSLILKVRRRLCYPLSNHDGGKQKTENRKPGATWRTENSSRKSPTLPAPAVWMSRATSPERKEGAGAIIP